MPAKLTLDLDRLSIESFDTQTAGTEKGTVFGEQCTCATNCTCPGCPTCDASCNGSCVNTCAVSCNGTCDNSCYGGCGGTEYECNTALPGCTTALYTACGPYHCL